MLGYLFQRNGCFFREVLLIVSALLHNSSHLADPELL